MRRDGGVDPPAFGKHREEITHGIGVVLDVLDHVEDPDPAQRTGPDVEVRHGCLDQVMKTAFAGMRDSGRPRLDNHNRMSEPLDHCGDESVPGPDIAERQAGGSGGRTRTRHPRRRGTCRVRCPGTTPPNVPSFATPCLHHAGRSRRSGRAPGAWHRCDRVPCSSTERLDMPSPRLVQFSGASSATGVAGAGTSTASISFEL